MSTARTRIGSVGIAVAVSASLSACSVSLDSVPLPAPGVGGDTYTLEATFSNALNLPAKAKVKLAGADVGEVESMTARNYTALVRMRIKSDVLLPVGSMAELRSATPLGDVFVSVKPPPNPASGSAVLRDGDIIALESTSAAATVEELLASTSLIVNGGAIRNLTKILNGLGAAVGGNGVRLATLINEASQLIGSLAARSGEIRNVLSQTNELTATLAAQSSTINDTVAAAGPALDVIAANTSQILDLVTVVDRITQQVAKFPSVNGTDTRGMIADLNTVSAAFNNVSTDPNVSLAALNRLLGPAIKMTNASTVHASGELAQLAIGALSDPNYPGDSGSRLPNVTDWTAFVGSLAYTLLRLKDRVIGPPR